MHFNSWQHGFRKTFSCETHLLCLTIHLNLILDRNSQASYVFPLFSKALDKVPHKLLMSRLPRSNIGSSVLNWITSFFANYSQLVFCYDGEPWPVHVEYGVPQGCVVGALLFVSIFLYIWTIYAIVFHRQLNSLPRMALFIVGLRTILILTSYNHTLTQLVTAVTRGKFH